MRCVIIRMMSSDPHHFSSFHHFSSSLEWWEAMKSDLAKGTMTSSHRDMQSSFLSRERHDHMSSSFRIASHHSSSFLIVPSFLIIIGMMKSDGKWWKVMKSDEKWWEVMRNDDMIGMMRNDGMMRSDAEWWRHVIMSLPREEWWEVMRSDEKWWGMMTWEEWWEMMQWWEVMRNGVSVFVVWGGYG